MSEHMEHGALKNVSQQPRPTSYAIGTLLPFESAELNYIQTSLQRLRDTKFPR